MEWENKLVFGVLFFFVLVAGLILWIRRKKIYTITKIERCVGSSLSDHHHDSALVLLGLAYDTDSASMYILEQEDKLPSCLKVGDIVLYSQFTGKFGPFTFRVER